MIFTQIVTLNTQIKGHPWLLKPITILPLFRNKIVKLFTHVNSLSSKAIVVQLINVGGNKKPLHCLSH